MSKSILKQLRAGGQMTEASLEPILVINNKDQFV
jgi:hypothetical protein